MPVIAFLAAAAVAGAPLAAGVDRIFAAYASPDGPGCAVAVEDKGRLVVNRAWGSADLEHAVPIRTDTIFEAGSVSKQFTAAAALTLVQDGRLKLADDVRRYVPELPSYGETITIAQLLDHTSGLRDWGSLMQIAGWPRGTRVYSNADVVDIASRQTALNHPPGEKFSYTNTGYNLLAVIVERISGKSFPEFTRERLFTPLGMAHTSWRDDFRRVVKDRAIAYDRAGPAWVQDMPFENGIGNGAMLTTTADLLRWNRALSEGRLGPVVTAELQRRSILDDGKPSPYGHGVFLETYRGLDEVSHGGATGGYRTWLGRYPARGLSIALLCNAGDARTPTLAHKVVDLFIPDQPPASPPAPKAPPALAPNDRDPSKLVGRYISDEVGAAYRVTLENGRLVARIDRRPDAVLRLEAVGPDRFSAGEATVTFHRIDDAPTGDVETMSVGVSRAVDVRFRRVD